MTPRSVSIDELPALVAAANRVFRPRGGDMGADYPLLFDPANVSRLRIVERNDTIVSHAGFVMREAVTRGLSAQVACFGAVFTALDHRGQGLGSVCFADAVAEARRAGASWGLISGERRLYARQGFRPSPAAYRVRVPARAAPDLTSSPARQEDVGLLARLHDAEPIRLARTDEIWRRLLTARIVFWSAGRVFLVRVGGTAVGYLAVEDQPRATEDGLWLRALEAAGQRSAVARAGAALAAAAGVRGVEIVAGAHDDRLIAAARQEGWQVAPARFPFGIAPLAGAPPLQVPWYGLDYV